MQSLLPDQSVVHITNINIEQHQIVFQFNLRIPTSEVPELAIQETLKTDKLSEKNGKIVSE